MMLVDDEGGHMAPYEETRVQICVRVPEETRKRLKKYLLDEDSDIQAFMETKIDEYLADYDKRHGIAPSESGGGEMSVG